MSSPFLYSKGQKTYVSLREDPDPMKLVRYEIGGIHVLEPDEPEDPVACPLCEPESLSVETDDAEAMDP